MFSETVLSRKEIYTVLKPFVQESKRCSKGSSVELNARQSTYLLFGGFIERKNIKSKAVATKNDRTK